MTQIAGRQVGPVGLGLMRLPDPKSPELSEQTTKALRAGLETGCNFWNAAEWYGGPGWNTQNLLAAYFKRYPEDVDKVVLSVKGAFDYNTIKADTSTESIKRSITQILKDLDGSHKVDVFQCARVDPKVPIEDAVKYIKEEYVDKGIVGAVGLSEVTGDTLRRAAKVAKIAMVEVELSLWSRHTFENGLLAAAAELNIPVIAHSPLGQGMLTGQVRSFDDIPDGEFRKFIPRFHGDNLAKNLELVTKIEVLAQKKGCTPGELAINWVKALSKKPGFPAIIPIPGASTEARVRQNAKDVDLTPEDLAAIDEVLKSVPIAGDRFPDFVPGDA